MKILKTDPLLDKAFNKINKKLNCAPSPEDFPVIYDFAKRLLNQHRFGARFIEKIYLLGRLKGAEENHIEQKKNERRIAQN